MLSPELEELVRRGEELYNSRLRAILESTHHGEFIAIEPESGDYFLALTLDGAIDAARAAHPDRITYTMRVGYRAAVGIGCWP